MNTPKKIDISRWNRREIFNFFKDFDEPFYGLTVNVTCTKAFEYCKATTCSFFLYYLHASLKAINETTAFKYRIKEDAVYLYEQINASPTIDKPDGTFGFSYMNYHPDFEEFQKIANLEIDRVRGGAPLIPAVGGENVVHFSSLPWIKFTSLSHARHYAYKDSCPKISFGKVFETNGQLEMPVSIHVHHALVDGKEVSQFIDLFQKLLETPPY